MKSPVILTWILAAVAAASLTQAAPVLNAEDSFAAMKLHGRNVKVGAATYDAARDARGVQKNQEISGSFEKRGLDTQVSKVKDSVEEVVEGFSRLPTISSLPPLYKTTSLPARFGTSRPGTLHSPFWSSSSWQASLDALIPSTSSQSIQHYVGRYHLSRHRPFNVPLRSSSPTPTSSLSPASSVDSGGPGGFDHLHQQDGGKKSDVLSRTSSTDSGGPDGFDRWLEEQHRLRKQKKP